MSQSSLVFFSIGRFSRAFYLIFFNVMCMTYECIWVLSLSSDFIKFHIKLCMEFELKLVHTTYNVYNACTMCDIGKFFLLFFFNFFFTISYLIPFNRFTLTCNI